MKAKKSGLDVRADKKKPKRLAIYVVYDKDGILDDFREYYINEVKKVTDYISVIVCGTLTADSRNKLEQLADDVYVRENKGLLAYGWLDGIAHIGWDKIYEYDELLLLNDSFFGPIYPLKDMFDAMEKSDADFYGAMRNFEEKSFKEIAGRPLKHGHFRGSICYFYVIKRRLLHSAEFKRYWSQHPVVDDGWDTVFFAEIDFYDFLLDAGFKIDSYQSDKLERYQFDNLSHSMRKLIEDEKIPFVRARSLGTDVRNQSMSNSYGKDPRKTLDYIQNCTDYDTDMIWKYLTRTKNLTHLWQQMQLEYVVSDEKDDKPFEYAKKIAAILHIYYDDQVERIARYCKNFPQNTDFYITTTSQVVFDHIENEFKKAGLNYTCEIRPNRGAAIPTLWVTYSKLVTEEVYEYVCYFHDKKSPYSEYTIQGEEFALRCFENLFGTEHVVKNIINLFEDNPRLGVVGAPAVYHGEYYASPCRTWPGNYENTVKLAKKLDLHVDINSEITPVAPYGDMLWFRSKALKKALSYGFTYEDFPEKHGKDNSLPHAVERIYGFAAQDSGYYYAEVITQDNARTDLMSYRYMLDRISETMMEIGCPPISLDYTTQVIRELSRIAIAHNETIGPCAPTARIIVKRAIKKRIPKPIWKVMRKIYGLFGGKKWVG